ncbi:uncharacterized protein LOC111030787 [Myzus persicae]|uniref:uncharacterized protein LOC111030787 n=1 Tax=Myzus persicae TaxID=13164 RepID=UPI000B930AC5|nr:uncharacterized protein LOC111030787 [Myzus persicae]XP_022166151.1 uncharacterized protein LOC111030787 [Myzus persicae]
MFAMFALMFESLFNKCEKKAKVATHAIEFEIGENTRQIIRELLTEINKINKNVTNGDSSSESKNNMIAIELLQDILSHSLFSLPSSLINVDDLPNNLKDSVQNVGNIKSKLNSFGKKKQTSAFVKDPNTEGILNQINDLQCLFTWNIIPNKKKNLILWIWNKYGEYNLNISSSEFTLERFIGNLIVSFEYFHKGEPELAQIKILEIGKWLEELDQGTDEFYLSINTGLQHIMRATLIHMLFPTNLTEECKWLLEDISSFAKMNSKSRASVHAVRAAVLTEYGENIVYLSKACDMAKLACDLDPKTSHWFYIHSLALTAERKCLMAHKLKPTDDEINAISQAVYLSNDKNPLFIYHEMLMDDISINKKNFPEKQKIANKIKTIVNLEPKDPHLVIKCAKKLMTLPTMVRDFNLGIQYLKKAFQMSQNDVTVLKAIAKAVEAYYNAEICKQINAEATEILQLEEELRLIVKKQKNGEDPAPYLIDLVSKYNGLNQSKILSQLCSYTLLFTNRLRYSVEQFNKLIEQPEVVNNDIIVNHISLFGSKKFDLSELICNEIRLASNDSGNSSDDMLYYYKTLYKIIETCHLKIKSVNSSMKKKILNSSGKKKKEKITNANFENVDEASKYYTRTIKKTKILVGNKYDNSFRYC